ncbi:MAG: glucose-6-phosphate isomerase [Mycoplasma sp.]|nr:glucose-6-phosphate isomerase [Mycoplasma sp.]
MVNIDLKYALDPKALDKYAEKVETIHKSMKSKTGVGNAFLGWLDWPVNFNKDEFKRILKLSKKLKEVDQIEVLVVIGIGGSYLGAKSAIDFVNGMRPIEKHVEVIFLGTSLSSIEMGQIMNYVKDKKFAINVISKSGTTTEPAIAFRMLKKLLIEKEGKNNANELISVTTDANKGILLKQALLNKWEAFVIPDDIGGRYSVFTAVGLLPMAVAGLDIKSLMKGAKNAYSLYSKKDLKNNIAYKYAVSRYILGKKFPVEMFISYEPSFANIQEWLKQLFAESEGKQSRGILPTSAIFTRDLHSLGQFIQEGSKIMFETSIDVEHPTMDIKLFKDDENHDGLNYLSKYSLNEINEIAKIGTIEAHALVGKVPNIQIKLLENNEANLGSLFYFFMRAAAMSSYLHGVNPFNQPGVEVYKSNMFKLLGKNKDKKK